MPNRKLSNDEDGDDDTDDENDDDYNDDDDEDDLDDYSDVAQYIKLLWTLSCQEPLQRYVRAHRELISEDKIER